MPAIGRQETLIPPMQSHLPDGVFSEKSESKLLDIITLVSVCNFILPLRRAEKNCVEGGELAMIL